MAKRKTLNEAEKHLQDLLTSHLLLFIERDPISRNRLEEKHGKLSQRLKVLIAEALEQEFF
jgi:hypothetical protein